MYISINSFKQTNKRIYIKLHKRCLITWHKIQICKFSTKAREIQKKSIPRIIFRGIEEEYRQIFATISTYLHIYWWIKRFHSRLFWLSRETFLIDQSSAIYIRISLIIQVLIGLIGFVSFFSMQFIYYY